MLVMHVLATVALPALLSGQGVVAFGVSIDDRFGRHPGPAPSGGAPQHGVLCGLSASRCYVPSPARAGRSNGWSASPSPSPISRLITMTPDADCGGATAVDGTTSCPEGIDRYAGDLQCDPFYRWLDRWFLLLQIPLGLGLYWFGEAVQAWRWPWLVLGHPLRLVVVYHVTWLVNSATTPGHRNFDCSDCRATAGGLPCSPSVRAGTTTITLIRRVPATVCAVSTDFPHNTCGCSSALVGKPVRCSIRPSIRTNDNPRSAREFNYRSPARGPSRAFLCMAIMPKSVLRPHPLGGS